MTTVGGVLSRLEVLAPLRFAMPGDNVGLLIGDSSAPVYKILCCLDVTRFVIDEAIAGSYQCIVSHHAPYYSAVNRIVAGDSAGNKIIACVKNGISVITMHTNLDAANGGVNDCFAMAVGLHNIEPLYTEMSIEGLPPLNRVGYVDPMPLSNFLNRVSAGLGTVGLRYIDSGRTVTKIGLGCGSSPDAWIAAHNCECDTYLSGEFKYAHFLAAAEAGINLVEAGHFATENVVTAPVCDLLRKSFADTEINIANANRDWICYYK